MIAIVQSGDLILTVSERYEGLMIVKGNERTPRIRQIAIFRVRREILSKNSPVFERMLNSGDFKETSSNTVQLEGDHVMSMEIWFRAIHHSVDPLYAVPVDELWHVIAAGDKYDLETKVLRSWFANWYDMQKYHDAHKVLYPCYTFDHAKGFMDVSKELVTNLLDISRRRILQRCLSCICSHELCVSQDIPGIVCWCVTDLIAEQFDAAKGRLKSILHHDLSKPVEPLLRLGNCPHVKDNVFGYFRTLLLLGVWPMEDAARTDTIDDILENLEDFRYSPSARCSYCSRDYDKIVKDVREYTQKYFDGLCLDCLDKTKPRTGDSDIDYWKHQEFKEDSWIEGCRIRHKQPSWYFLFMGRKADRELFP
ncbi:hypothetical protein MMC14_003641 [Varicellaria rhodocarpa]|nr:hypothetical protein [Varicellaria rhodocarpa]